MNTSVGPALTDNRRAEAGLFLIVVVLPLVFVPFTTSPLVDGKLVVLLAGTLLFALSKVEVDRSIAVFSAIWIAVLSIAALAGLAPWWSFLGAEAQGTGVLALGACAVLLCLGTAVDDKLASRVPVWLLRTGVLVSALTVVGRFIDLGDRSVQLNDLSGTGLLRLFAVGFVGHRVFVGGFIAAVALAAIACARSRWLYLSLLVVGSGLAVSAVRSAWIGVVVGLAVTLWRRHWRWKSVIGVLIPLLIALGAWTVADRYLPASGIEYSAAPRFTQLEEGSAQERLSIWNADLRAWEHDPILGSGPGTALHGYLAHATPHDIKTSGRNNGDAHNIVIEHGTTSGVLGVLALLALASVLWRRIRHASEDRAWAAGMTAAVGVVHLFQPLNLRLTPLLFLGAGLAAGPAASHLRTRLRGWLIVLIVASMALTSCRFTASALDWYGSKFASETALRWSLRFEPQRLSALLHLASHRAFDATNDPAATRDTRNLVRRAVREYGWHPDTRLICANLLVAIRDDPSHAERYIDDDLRIFPNDPMALVGKAVLALRDGRKHEAATFARRALVLDPTLELARTTLRSAIRTAPRD